MENKINTRVRFFVSPAAFNLSETAGNLAALSSEASSCIVSKRDKVTHTHQAARVCECVCVCVFVCVSKQ